MVGTALWINCFRLKYPVVVIPDRMSTNLEHFLLIRSKFGSGPVGDGGQQCRMQPRCPDLAYMLSIACRVIEVCRYLISGALFLWSGFSYKQIVCSGVDCFYPSDWLVVNVQLFLKFLIKMEDLI